MYLLYVILYAIRTAFKSQKLRKHSRLNAHQLSVLEAAFSENVFLNQTTLKQLACQTGIKKARIRSWFYAKRKYIRKRMEEGTLSKGEGTKTDR